jgi:2-amino-4-hydroxy-6-hydroxymethyldihydropteridine diphosphokinase
MSRAVLSIGSNLGDRIANLRLAVKLLGDSVVLVSGVYETPPWGDPDQPSYLNAVLLVTDPRAAPGDWLERAHACEAAAGRVRDPQRRFGPRTLDADDQPVFRTEPDLVLPHPRAHERAFVLRPWIDIQPYGQLPGHGWLTDLLNAPALADEIAAMQPRGDLPLEST